ncbi:unnamed protein product [Cylindrotheca closterium]|uniref:Bicarbonate transporter-like transmembrane domain-containing protein n=1 Tax=Cylindrotheca closterium TaxID=2856 RepID=A0AAD2JH66_9STRA|nr:unnamed protein product [Cylindrotheca closterium]
MSKSKSSMFQTLSPLPSLAALKIVVTTPTDCPDQAEPWGRRPWIVDLYDLNGNTEVIFIAAALGIPAFILTFLDNGITWHIVNHPSNRLAHGDAYNYDTVTSAIMVSW